MARATAAGVLIPYPMRFIHGNERPGRIGVGVNVSVLGIVLRAFAQAFGNGR